MSAGNILCEPAAAPRKGVFSFFRDSSFGRLVFLFLIVAGVLFIDQLSKIIVLQRLSPVYSQKVIDGFFSLTLVMNSGVAFGVFSGINSVYKAWVLLAVSGITAVAVVIYYFYDQALTLFSRLALALVVGGALGNIIDRWRYHKVVDFLDFYWGDYHFPAFNVADCAISIGVSLLLCEVLLLMWKQNASSPD